MSSEESHAWLQDVRVGCLTSNAMAASSLLPVFLLLLLALRDQPVGSTRSERADDLDSHFRRHWLLHMRDALLRGKDGEQLSVSAQSNFITLVLFKAC